MFTKPLSEIEFTDVEAFCREFGEGVRVEYKGQMIKQIPKTISAFANTLGGIIVVGVKTDKQNRAIFPIDGIDAQDGIEDQITHSALSGIYPSVLPQIKVRDVPGKAGKIVVVIKVEESLQAPHAIQNSTRIYVRTGSLSNPYELAEIDRIEYLLKRREQPVATKEAIIGRADERFRTYVMKKIPEPYINVVISPTFPYQPVMALDDVFAFAREFHFRPYLDLARIKRVYQGVFAFSPDLYYVEINQYGIVIFNHIVEKVRDEWAPEEDEKQYLRFLRLPIAIGHALRLAEVFWESARHFGNIEVRAKLCNIAGESLPIDPEVASRLGADLFRSFDNEAFAVYYGAVEQLGSDFGDVVSSVVGDLMWSFNQTTDPIRVDNKVKEILAKNNMLPPSTERSACL